MAHILARVGSFSARHKWPVIAAWLVVLLLAGAGAAGLAKPMDDSFSISGLNSISTLDRIDQEFGLDSDNSGKIVFAAPEGQKLTKAELADIRTLQTTVAGLDGVSGTPQQTLSPDGRTGFLSVDLTGSTVPDGLDAAVDAARGSSSLQIAESSELAPEEDGGSEAAGLLIALAVLVVTFGSLVSAGLPLLGAVIGLGISECAIYLATRFVTLNSVAPTLATLLALAVGIDYSLFIINRHLQNLRTGMSVPQSIRLTLASAGSAVFFAAMTVVIALAGLAVMRIGFLTQMGVSAAVAVLIAMLVALTLTPALLSLAGPRALGRRTRRRLAQGDLKPQGKLAQRWAGVITKHPVVPVLLSVLLLAGLAAPVLNLRLGLPDDGSQPTSSTARQAYDLMAEGFGPGANGPILVLGTAAQEAGIESVPGVSSVQPSGQKGDQVLLTVYPSSSPNAEATTTLVHTLREIPGLEVSGQTAVAIDVSEVLADRLPLYLGLIVGLTFLLLLVVFRSLLVPLKATISFLLSLGAALGCTVLAFQNDPAGPLLSFLPVLVIGVLFGLSMDYEMFLLSGMQERHRRGEPARAAVVSGFGNGARVVAAAALIMIGVFGNGAIVGDSTIRPIAFSLAVGVLVDAFVVRLVLVPALMRLFGEGAWWLPRWLDRIIPQLDLEGTQFVQEEQGTGDEPAGLPERTSAPTR